MSKFKSDEELIKVCRDCGYNILELLSPENRKRARKNVKNPNYLNSNYRLKELFAKIGIVVNPEKNDKLVCIYRTSKKISFRSFNP